MMTLEQLNNNEALTALTDEQKSAILDLAKTSEDTAIGERIGKIYGDLDADILSASGMEKTGTEKTYAYAKRVIGALREQGVKSAALQSEVETLRGEKAALEEALEKGADDETKKALAQAKTDLTSITTKYTELVKQQEEAQAKHEKELFELRVGMELETAAKGIKFKASIPASVADVVVKEAIESVKKLASAKVEDGVTSIIYKGEDGETLRDDKMQPKTGAALLTEKLDAMGIVDKRKAQGGAGSSGGGSGEYDKLLISAKTQNEAMEIIHATLTKQGLVRGSQSYQDALDRAWKENGLNKLPVK